MNKSDSIASLAAALAQAQGEMPAAPMNAVNPFLKNKYADLGAIIKTATPIMAKHGLSVTQHPYSDGQNIGVTTILAHSSGEWMESELSMLLGEERGKSSAQVAGSIITYLRRYALAAVLGMYADEDTDGHTGPGNGKTQPEGNQQQPSKTAEKPANGNSSMTIEQASEVTNAEGIKYIDLDNEKLSNMTAGISKALNKTTLTAEQRSEYEFKRKAISAILKSRNGGN